MREIAVKYERRRDGFRIETYDVRRATRVFLTVYFFANETVRFSGIALPYVQQIWPVPLSRHTIRFSFTYQPSTADDRVRSCSRTCFTFLNPRMTFVHWSISVTITETNISLFRLYLPSYDCSQTTVNIIRTVKNVLTWSPPTALHASISTTVEHAINSGQHALLADMR